MNLNTAQTYCADYQAANPNNRVIWNFIDYSMITKGVDSVTGKRYVFLMGGPNADSFNHNAVIGWDRVLSSKIVNEARIGFNRYNLSQTANSFGINENNVLGIPNGNIPGLPYTSGIA